MKVEITDRAAADIRAIALWITRDNRSRAQSFARELRQRCKAIGSRPRAYPLLGGFEEKGIRHCPHGRYLIFYRVDAHRVRILHVLHGAREYGPILESA